MRLPSIAARELQEAIYRIKRLPFVVEADLALRKGSERGRYELVVTVEETRPLFLDYSLAGFHQASSPGFVVPHSNLSWSNSGTLALRQFVGAQGFAFASVSADGPSRVVQLGYTQYSAFGANSYATLLASSEVERLAGHNLDLTGELGIPLASNLMVIVTPGWFRQEGPGRISGREINGDVSLVYRTTDDPIIPTSGADLELGVLGSSQHQSDAAAGFGAFTTRTTLRQLAVQATDYWPVTRQQSVGLSASASIARDDVGEEVAASVNDVSVRATQAEVDLLYTASLWNAAATRRFGDLRFESSAGYSFLHQTSGADFSVSFASTHQLNLAADLVFRNEWGILRFSLLYAGRVEP